MEGLTRAGTVPGRYEHTVTLMRLYHDMPARCGMACAMLSKPIPAKLPGAVCAQFVRCGDR